MLWTHNFAWRKFYSLFLNIVTDCLKNLRNFKCGILQLLILNQIEGMHLPTTSLFYKT